MTGDFSQRRDRAYRGASRMLTGHGRAVAGRLGLQRYLQRYLPRMPAYVACARQVAAAIQDSGAGLTQPSPVHTNSFRVFLAAPAEALNVAVVEHAEATGE